MAKSEEQVRKTNSRPEQVRSYGVTLAMLADLFADNGIAKEACPIYAKAERVWLDLDKRGVLTQLDRHNAPQMHRDRQQPPVLERRVVQRLLMYREARAQLRCRSLEVGRRRLAAHEESLRLAQLRPQRRPVRVCLRQLTVHRIAV